MVENNIANIEKALSKLGVQITKGIDSPGSLNIHVPLKKDSSVSPDIVNLLKQFPVLQDFSVNVLINNGQGGGKNIGGSSIGLENPDGSYPANMQQVVLNALREGSDYINMFGAVDLTIEHYPTEENL